MLTLLSPTKTVALKDVPKCETGSLSAPQFFAEAAVITGLLKYKTVEELTWILNCSYGVADKQKNMLESWRPRADKKNGVPAISCFDDFSRSIDLTTWEKKDFDFMQKKVGILSSLYGYLRPLDAIVPYVLPMDTILHTARGKRIFDYWEATNTAHLENLLTSNKETEILNLLTVNARRAINFPKNSVKVYEVAFIGIGENGRKNRSIASWQLNKVRANLVEYLVKSRVDKVEKIKNFEFEQFKYNEQHSTENLIVFSRNI